MMFFSPSLYGALAITKTHGLDCFHSTLIRLKNGKMRLYVKGAAELMLELCDRQLTKDGKEIVCFLPFFLVLVFVFVLVSYVKYVCCAVC